jgi:cytochrome c-type biogenesis protein CcmH
VTIHRVRLAAGLLLAVLGLLTALPAAGLALTVNEVAREVRCPSCNTPLDTSSAPVALDMKEYIAERIDQGWTKQRIIDGLVAEFGREVLTTPPKSGFDLVAWIVPALAVAAGLAALPFVARAWSRRRGSGPAPAEIAPEDALRLEEELRRHPT